MIVQTLLESRGISYVGVELGRVELTSPLNSEQYGEFNNALKYYELEILENRRAILVERIKSLIIEMIRSDNMESPLKFTAYLSKVLGYDYTHLSNTFSEEEDSTIERFYITNRVERVKELIVYEDMSLKEIAYRLQYSSVSHLCQQFKKVTGNTPSTFKKLCESPAYVWKKL